MAVLYAAKSPSRYSSSVRASARRVTSMLQTAVRPTELEAPAAHDAQAATVPGPELTVIVPTRNEYGNIVPVYDALRRTLHGVNWEAIFVDDDSQDGTAEAVCRLANRDRRVRCIQRIG